MTELTAMMVRWYRGAATAAEKAKLLEGGYLRKEVRGIFVHYLATSKGYNAVKRLGAADMAMAAAGLA